METTIRNAYTKKYQLEHKEQHNKYIKKCRNVFKDSEEENKAELEKKIRAAKAAYQKKWHVANAGKRRECEKRKIYREQHKEQQKLISERCWTKKVLQLAK